MDATAEIRQQLLAWGDERIAHRVGAAKASDEIAAWAKRAVDAGMPKTEIAALAKISRPALDTMLRR